MLRVDLFTEQGRPFAHAEVAAGEWVRLDHPEPKALLAVIAGQAAGHGRVLLAGQDLVDKAPQERVRVGLAVCSGQLPDLPGMRVLDVLQLARPVRLRAASWRALLGSRRARAALGAEEATVRSIAERLGLTPWLEHPAVQLPAVVAAAADLAGGLAGVPRALVWREPQAHSEELAAVLADEQRRLGCAVLSLRRGEHAR